MNDLDRDLRRQLRLWDPAERLGNPHPQTVAEMRAALERAARGRRRFVPLLAVGALTAAVLGLLLFVPGDAPRPVPEAAVQPVNIAFTASNGVRIHWSVYPHHRRPAAGLFEARNVMNRTVKHVLAGLTLMLTAGSAWAQAESYPRDYSLRSLDPRVAELLVWDLCAKYGQKASQCKVQMAHGRQLVAVAPDDVHSRIVRMLVERDVAVTESQGFEIVLVRAIRSGKGRALPRPTSSRRSMPSASCSRTLPSRSSTAA